MYFRKTTYILRSPKRWDQLGKEADQDHSVGGRDHAVTIDVRGFLLLGRELHQIRQAAREQHRVGGGHHTVTVEVAKQILRLPAHGALTILIGMPSGRERFPHDRAAIQTCHDPQAVLRAGGFAQFANPKKVRLVRTTPQGRKAILVNLDDVMRRGNLNNDVYIRDGDVIIIDEKNVNF